MAGMTPETETLCQHCHKRLPRTAKSRFCLECATEEKRRQRREYKARNREHERAADRARYEPKKNRDPGVTSVPPDFAARWGRSLLPHQLQAVPPERLVEAAQRILDEHEAQRFDGRLRDEIHAAVAEARRRFKASGVEGGLGKGR